MNERELNIVQKAFKLFVQYGVSKTSMTEISAAAKVARQTLYKSFESKEDLIFAALLHYGGQTKADIERECASTTDLGERLDVMFRHMGSIPFQAMRAYPHMDEVLEIVENLPDERRSQIKANYVSAIRLVLAPWEKGLAANGVDLTGLTGLIRSTLTQIRRDADDEAHLASLFAPLRALIVQSAS